MAPHPSDALRTPKPFDRLIDAVMARDREFFERHPDATEYTRPYVPGEAWPLHHPSLTRVRVVQVGRGLRARYFLPEPEGGAQW